MDIEWKDHSTRGLSNYHKYGGIYLYNDIIRVTCRCSIYRIAKNNVQGVRVIS